MKDKIVPIVAILAIFGMMGLAFAEGIDGAVFSFAIAAVAGIGGYKIRRTVKKD